MDTYALRTNVQVRLLDRAGVVGACIAGRFRIEALLARGATGRVYLAEQVGLGRKVAVKVLDLEAEQASGLDFSLRFAREAATLARLTHRNIVRVVDFGVWEGHTWLAMEYVDGITLHQALGAQAFTPARSVSLMLQVCGALADAHAQGVVHRDLKPSNLLLTAAGSAEEQVKLVDFGLVKDLQDPGLRTDLGTMMGSPRYMAPEQIREEDVDARVDIYALGVILQRCLTGSVPFDGVEPFAIMYAHLHTAPPSVVAEGVPPCLRWTVDRCLEKEAEDRFADVGELSAALERCASVLRGEAPWESQLHLREGRLVAEAPPRRRAPVSFRRGIQGAALAAAVLLGFALGQLPGEGSGVTPAPVQEAVDQELQVEPERGVPDSLVLPEEIELPALVTVASSSGRRMHRPLRSAPMRAVVTTDRGMITHASAEPEVDLAPDSPWAGAPAMAAHSSVEDPWATGASAP